GFKKSKEIPVGEFKWLTVSSAEGPDHLELVLEPNANPAAKEFQEAIFNQGIPITAFEADDIQTEYERLKSRGVIFTMAPTNTGGRVFFGHLRESHPAISAKTAGRKRIIGFLFSFSACHRASLAIEFDPAIGTAAMGELARVNAKETPAFGL